MKHRLQRLMLDRWSTQKSYSTKCIWLFKNRDPLKLVGFIQYLANPVVDTLLSGGTFCIFFACLALFTNKIKQNFTKQCF